MSPEVDDRHDYEPRMVLYLILILTLISTWFLCERNIIHNFDIRAEHEEGILSGQIEPPYKYRVLLPLAGSTLQTLISPVVKNDMLRHSLSYSVIVFISFFCIFYLFHKFLKGIFTSREAGVIGILLLQAVIPLSVTGHYMEDDYITVVFYLLGLNAMLYGKDIYLPLIIGFGTVNREQTVFLIVFYVVFLISHGRLLERRSVSLIVACVSAFILAYVGVRMLVGVEDSEHTIRGHIEMNTEWLNLRRRTIPLWTAEVAGFVFLCILAFRKSNLFFRLSFLSIGVYALLFFTHGALRELAKFLPAYLIMIPMCLQKLIGEYPPLKQGGT